MEPSSRWDRIEATACTGQTYLFREGALLKRIIIVAGFALAIIGPAHADPQRFADETKATAFCKAGNVVWFNPDTKIYFPPGKQYYGKTKAGGYTCKSFAEKDGYRPTKGN